MQVFSFLTDATVVFFFANTLYVISYMLTSMLWLRVLAIIAAISTFPYFYFQHEPLWSALFWQACFLLVNLTNLVILLISMRAASFHEDESLAHKMKFSNLKHHEVRPIFKYARRFTAEPGRVLLKEGAQNMTLFLILKGECKVVKNDTEIAVLGPGYFLGELSFLEDDVLVSADVIATEDMKLMCWNKFSLAPLFKREALYENYFYSLCSFDIASKLRKTTAARTG